MKKLGGLIVSACLAGSLIGGPALASTAQVQQPSRAETLELCKAFFAAEGCEEVAGSWYRAVTTGDRDAIERFADRLLADAGARAKAPPKCRDIFSETVCGTIDRAIFLVLDIVGRPLYYVDEVRRLVVWVTDQVVYQINCILTQSCGEDSAGQRSASSDDPCREVFSDAVCDYVEEVLRDPPGHVAYWINYTYQIVRCYLDPACTPIVIACTDLICPRAALPTRIR